MLRIRLRRTGAKKQPRYRVVVADARAPRDGAFVENIGYYDPLTEPSTVRIDRESALSWLAKGAQPSDTVLRLLRREGIVEGEASRPAAPEPPTAVAPPVPAAAPATEALPANDVVPPQAAATEEPADDGGTVAE